MIGLEFIKFIGYSLAIVVIVKYLLVKLIRRLAEGLSLQSKTVGNIAGISTSIPELLTIGFSASSGLIQAGIYNVMSSNLINLFQYFGAVIFNKNIKLLKSNVVIINILMVIVTILLPITMIILKIESEIYWIPIFLILAVIFYIINSKIHRLYHVTDNLADEEIIEKETKKIQNRKWFLFLHIVGLVVISVLLFFIGERLSNALENLCQLFGISEMIIGILLGFITSLPEFITFFESQKHFNKKDQKEEGMIEATNNLLTSNILNLFIIQSIAIAIFYFIS